MAKEKKSEQVEQKIGVIIDPAEVEAIRLLRSIDDTLKTLVELLRPRTHVVPGLGGPKKPDTNP